MKAGSEGQHHVVPPDEHKCVWMSAGILSYQLCEREFDCERCPLDQAMRAHFRRGAPGGPEPAGAEPVAAAGAPAHPPRSPRRTGLRRDRLYGRGHCWVKRRGDSGGAEWRVRIGLEPGLAAALLVPRAVVHDEPGSPVRQGEPHLWIVTEGGTFGVPAPLSGMLHQPNPRLSDRPHLAVSEPLDEGWLFELRVPAGSIDGARLLDAAAAARLYETDAERFRHEIQSALEAQSARTPVLADGGVLLQSVSDMLGPLRYFVLLRRVYGAPEP